MTASDRPSISTDNFIGLDWANRPDRTVIYHHVEFEQVLRGDCGKCGHEWVIAHLPMEITKVARLALRAACPKCGGDKVFIKQPHKITKEDKND